MNEKDRTGKFKGVFDAKREPPTLVEVLGGEIREIKPIGSGVESIQRPSSPAQLEAKEVRAKEILRSADRAPIDRKRGGKRSDPDYEPITVFVRKETYRRVKIALLEDERNKQAGELIEELLSKWIDEKN